MQSFRTEHENPVIEKDILELERKIYAFKNGEIDEDRFRTLRLARGVYGQRQPGVQMIRIKIPYGRISAAQLRRIASVSDRYSDGKLHITTRQDIQIHHVSLDDTPQLWSELEQDDITLREACGNTVRNITASALSGIEPNEVFDVRPYAQAAFAYFLRNATCQEMGRKVKISFSNSSEDTALGFMHDLGFIAKIEQGKRGFKVLLAGGLGSQSRQADVLYEFYPADAILPLIESVLRLFDRHGERANRMKARLKFLVKQVGVETFRQWVLDELPKVTPTGIDISDFEDEISIPIAPAAPHLTYDEAEEFDRWKKLQVLEQKQGGIYAAKVPVSLGNFSSDQARAIADFIEQYTGNEITFTIDQQLIIRHIPQEQLRRVFSFLKELNLSELGVNNTSQVTACPGTDTCNLAIANSTSLALRCEALLHERFQNHVKATPSIKISGCMNSCGQHMIANIGFQGMSINAGKGKVMPAVQVLLGGANLKDGNAAFADKVIKIPSKRALQALNLILDDYEAGSAISFYEHYAALGDRYFYDLLKPLADTTEVGDEEFIDWGQEAKYEKAIGVGECAGVVIDLVTTLFKEAEEKLEFASEAIHQKRFADSMYHSYSAIIQVAKALLTKAGKRTNSYAAIIEAYQEQLELQDGYDAGEQFKELVQRHAKTLPNAKEAMQYVADAIFFVSTALKNLNEVSNEVEA